MSMFVMKMSFHGLSTMQDYEDAVQFFKDKDTSKYRMSLEQTKDTIKAKAALIEVGTPDV
jgi:aminopeptidase 2